MPCTHVPIHRIPTGTSKELSDLLVKLLKRNAKDRLDFEEFFQHPFVKPVTVTKPLLVPHAAAGSSSPIASSPQSPASYGSPLIMHMTHSPVTEAHNSHNSSSDEQVDDFVVVPKLRSEKGSPPLLSSGRSMPEPVPVPSQREAYEKMRRSRTQSADDECVTDDGTRNASVESDGSLNRYVPDITQISPPGVQFVIGTPPGLGLHQSLARSNRRTSAPHVTANLSQNRNSMQRQLTPPYSLVMPPVGMTQMEQMRPVMPENMSPFQWGFRQGSPITSPVLERRSSGRFAPNARAIAFDQTAGCAFQHSPGSAYPSPAAHFSSPGGCCCHGSGVAIRPIPCHLPHHLIWRRECTLCHPKLPAETLLDKDHNETLAKLNFILALVDSIVSVAETRASPLSILTESTCRKVCIDFQCCGNVQRHDLLLHSYPQTFTGRPNNWFCTCGV